MSKTKWLFFKPSNNRATTKNKQKQALIIRWLLGNSDISQTVKLMLDPRAASVIQDFGCAAIFLNAFTHAATQLHGHWRTNILSILPIWKEGRCNLTSRHMTWQYFLVYHFGERISWRKNALFRANSANRMCATSHISVGTHFEKWIWVHSSYPFPFSSLSVSVKKNNNIFLTSFT